MKVKQLLSGSTLWFSLALVVCLTQFPQCSTKTETPGPSSVAGASLSGQWIADIPTNEQHDDSTRLVLDVGQIGSRWVGEFDLMEFGVENYPVQVTVTDSAIVLFFTAASMEFTGNLSRDGHELSGVGVSEEDKTPVRFSRRSDAPRFSEGFLALEVVADDSSRVKQLSADGAELRSRFNADSTKTRLLMLLAPS